MKKLLLLLVVLVPLWLIVVWAQPEKEPAVVSTADEKTNFVQEGILEFPRANEQGQDTPYLSYVSSTGAPTTTIELPISEKTVCATRTGALPCMAMSVQYSVAFGGKRAVVEGIEKEARLDVRVIRVIDEEAPVLVPGPGVTYIPWAQAVALIESCEPTMIVQAHNLNVNLTLPDERVVTAIEPVIDEVFRVVDRTRDVCGTIPLATE